MIFNRGDEKRSGYVQYVQFILPNVPARTTFIEICMYVCIGFISLKHGYTFINEKRVRSQCEISTMLSEWMLQ